MNPEEFFRLLAEMRVHSQKGRRSPHKPLLMLLALGRLAQGKPRLASYTDDIETPLTHLLKSFGGSRTSGRGLAPSGGTGVRRTGGWGRPARDWRVSAPGWSEGAQPWPRLARALPN